MDVSKKEATAIRRALAYWGHAGLLGADQAASLNQDLKIIPFDWRLLARLSFLVAIICIVTAIVTAFADRAILELLERVFNSPHYVKLIELTVLSVAIMVFGYRQRLAHPQRIFSNEAIMFLGVLGIASALYQLGMTFDTGSGDFAILLLLSFIIYAVLGLFLQSNLIWIFALVSIGGWFGAKTGYMSGWGSYYLGMNYPLRFVLFGGLLTAVALGIQRVKFFEICRRSTLVMGLLYLFTALWILSIWGNSASWYNRSHVELFLWSLLFGAVACAAIFHGLRTGDGVTRGFGVVFLFINLYTKFFEHFWEGTYKVVFFTILAVSFWVIGHYAEKIWYIGAGKPAAAAK
jgi:hypothetical protein